MHIDRGRRTAVLTFALLVVALALPAATAAHAELVSTTPAADSTVDVSPTIVSATFDDDLVKSKSSIEVLVKGGDTVATGGVSADDPKTLAVAVPTLAPGTYRVRWASATDDGHLERGRFDFTVTAAPSPEPTVEPTAAPTDAPGVVASATPVASVASTTPPAAASPTTSPTAIPSADGSGSGSESMGQLLVIAVAGVGIGVGIGWWRSRRAG